jgi:hypothetical protein
MSFMIRFMLWPMLAGLVACNPTFNWRDTRVQDTGLAALLPCKPDQTVRPVLMGGGQREMHMLGCETGAALFAIAHVSIGPGAALAGTTSTATLASNPAAPPAPSPLADLNATVMNLPLERNRQLLAQWREANLAAMRAASSSSAMQQVRGADAVPAAQKTVATGLRPDNSRVESQAVYFARGSQLFYAVILADRIPDDVAEAFFAGLKLE